MNEILSALISYAPVLVLFLCVLGFDQYNTRKKGKARRLLDAKNDALDAAASGQVIEKLSTALRVRGFELAREGERVVGRDGETQIDFGFAPGQADAAFFVQLAWTTTARTMSMSWDASRHRPPLVVLETDTWRATFSWHDVLRHKLVDDQRRAWDKLGVIKGNIRDGRSNLSCAPKVRDVGVHPEVFLEHLLAQRSRMGMWTSRPVPEAMLDLEAIIPTQADPTIASFYEEAQTLGILSSAEVFARVALLPDRDAAPFSYLLNGTPAEEVVRSLDVERTLALHEALQQRAGWRDVEERLSRALAARIEPEDLLDHPTLSAPATLSLVRQWRRDAGGARLIDDCARIDATLATMWPDRPTPWRVGILGERVSSFEVPPSDPEPHRVIEAAASLGQTSEEHVALSHVLRLIRADVLEREGVIDALITQIERSPPGSNGAIVEVIALRQAQNIRRELLRRVRGADPLSPLAEAAQRLCDPERLRGALTASQSSGEGGLSLSTSERGALTQSARSETDDT